MQFKTIRKLTGLLLFFSLTACNGFFEKDNLPPPKALTAFSPEVSPALLWSTGVGSGVGYDYLKLRPSVDGRAVYASGTNGTVAAFNKATGRSIWQTNTHIAISTGPGNGCDIVVVGSRIGDIVALEKSKGKIIWHKKIEGEILAQPAIQNKTVIVKTTDGTILALSAETGDELWVFQHPEPSLILRGSSAPVIRDNNVFVGFADGNLAKLSLAQGRLDWLETVAIPEGAFAIQRMVDIDADPVIYDHQIYAATYQGKIAELTWSSGRIEWSRDISSYTGMVASDQDIFITDAKSHILSLNAKSGAFIWQQDQLEARGVTGPASMGPFIVVGDRQGYLHWINKSNGRFAARVYAGNAMNATPLVEDNVLYVMTNNGTLIAYTLR